MKILLSLMAVMLVVVIVFSTFGFSMRNSAGDLDFFSAFSVVGNKIGALSQWTVFSYDFVKGFFDKVYPSVEKALNSILKLLSAFEERWHLIDSAIWYINEISEYFMRQFNIITYTIDFFSERGFDIFTSVFWRSYFGGMRCITNEDFLLSDGSVNNKKIFAYLDAYYYGVENEYSYELSVADRKSFKYANKSEAYTIVFGETLLWEKLTIDNSLYWFTVPNIKVPEDYLPAFSEKDRLLKYFDGSIVPVYKSNMTYTYKGDLLYLCGVEFVEEYDHTYNNPLSFSGTYSFPVYVLHFYYYEEESNFASHYAISLNDYYYEMNEKLSPSAVFRLYNASFKLYQGIYTRDDYIPYSFKNIFVR